MENLAKADITSCGARVARCVCIKPMGHVKDGDDIHACDPTICGGSWRGEEPDFYPVTFPSPGGVNLNA